MNTFLSRANTIFAFTLSVMAALTFGCFLTTAFNDHKAPATINTAKAIVWVDICYGQLARTVMLWSFNLFNLNGLPTLSEFWDNHRPNWSIQYLYRYKLIDVRYIIWTKKIGTGKGAFTQPFSVSASVTASFMGVHQMRVRRVHIGLCLETVSLLVNWWAAPAWGSRLLTENC